MGIAGSEALDGTLDNRARRLQIRITDAEDDHVLAALAGSLGVVMRDPRIGALATDPVNERSELHRVSAGAP